ncbi:MAG: LysE family transporter [Chloroflexi bacterium]|nr:LysE family transporter [Chloroflexota bacterium]
MVKFVSKVGLGNKGAFSIFLGSFAVGLSGALMPGSLLALTIATVATSGFWAGPAIVVGHAIAELVTVVVLSRGVGAVLRGRAVRAVVGIAGGSFLLWMSYGLLGAALNVPEVPLPGSLVGVDEQWAIMSGLVVTVTNPYWLLWWVTVGAGYMIWVKDQRTRAGVALFYMGHTMSDAVWYTAVALVLAAGAKMVTPVVYRGLLGICGVAMVILGGYFILSGARSLKAGSARPIH